MKRHLLFLLIFGCLMASCSKIEEPEFRGLSHFEIRDPSLKGVAVSFEMRYFNPNDFSVAVKETVADVYVDSVFLGNFRQDTTVAVKENAEFGIPLVGKISLSTLSKLDIRDIHKRQVLVRANGSTKVGKAGIFISKQISYSGQHRLSQLKW